MFLFALRIFPKILKEEPRIYFLPADACNMRIINIHHSKNLDAKYTVTDEEKKCLSFLKSLWVDLRADIN